MRQIQDMWEYERLEFIVGLCVLAVLVVTAFGIWQSCAPCTPGETRMERECITGIWANNMWQCTQQGPEYAQTCDVNGEWKP